MTRFLTFDFNGWLDYIVDQNDETRSLGFRSCFHKHNSYWLMGAQAHSAARYKKSFSSSTTVDAIQALKCSAGLEPTLPEWDGNPPLTSALWKSIEETSRIADESINLALVISDDKGLGSSKISNEKGITKLETLHSSLDDARPAKLLQSRIELIWRSVAVVQAVLNQGNLPDFEGHVLVISVNERITWRVIELRRWQSNSKYEKKIRIVRSPYTGNGDNSAASGEFSWITGDRYSNGRKSSAIDIEKFTQWTRWAEILATDASPKTLQQLGIDPDGIEHRSWAKSEGKKVRWQTVAPTFSVGIGSTEMIQSKLFEVVENFTCYHFDKDIPIIIENPIGEIVARKIEPCVQNLDTRVEIFHVSGPETVEAASKLAKVLVDENHPDGPAWLDSVPEIQLEVRNKQSNGNAGAETQWITVVSGDQAIPAGKVYLSPEEKNKRITLAPGIEQVHLHLRRGDELEGGYTRHPIVPSDYIKLVEPMARVRPLSSVAQIEFIEHLRNGKVADLSGAAASIKWQDLEKDRPLELRSIPELFIFEASCAGWLALEPVLTQIANLPDDNIPYKLLDDLYKITNEQWKERVFPLGSDGLPPWNCGQNPNNSIKLLKAATNKLLKNLVNNVIQQNDIKKRHANRLHMGITWLFTVCPDKVVDILLDSILNPNEKAGQTLYVNDAYSAWSIYSGVGRATQSEELLRRIYDDLILIWETNGEQKQDKFLLAAVSHPLARRVAARRVLCEDRDRFERVKRFLEQQLDNLISGNFDTRPGGKPQPSTELRYILMGFRGLCQVRYRYLHWFPVDGEDANRVHEKFMQVQQSSRFKIRPFESCLLKSTVPYLIGEGEDPTMPGGF